MISIHSFIDEMIKLSKDKVSPLQKMFNKFGIEHTEKTEQHNSVPSIGYSPSRDKWYGWSHRAVHGFGVGDKVPNDPDITEDHKDMVAGAKIKTIEKAKRVATLFANSVS